jgi:predicted metal-dependent HD superfamily phosphohydrolase
MLCADTEQRRIVDSVLPFELSAAIYEALRFEYDSSPRRYHNFGHVIEVLSDYRSCAWKAPASVAWAILFHDAVYEPGRTDNEANSADVMERCLKGTNYDIERIRHLIMLTARHGTLLQGDVDDAAAQFLDCDMAILGAPDSRYKTYANAIRYEYGMIDDDVYRVGRSAFLKRLLALPSIYLTPRFRTTHEESARRNIACELRETRG